MSFLLTNSAAPEFNRPGSITQEESPKTTFSDLRATPKQAEAHYGGLAIWVAGNGPASNERTKAILEWEPREVGFISHIERPGYSE